MKKAISILFFALIVIFSSYAGNDQKIYTTSSPEKQAIDYLSIAEGIAMPSSSGPWSQAELSLMLKQIDVNKLSESEKEIYQSLIDKFDKERNLALLFFDPGISINFELSMHTNKNDFLNPDMIASWSNFGDFNRPTPFVSVPISAYVDKLLYLYAQIDA